MTERAIASMVERLSGLPPLSPGFFAFRDDLEHFASAESARMARAIAAVSHCSDYLAELAQAWRRAEHWARQLEGHSAGLLAAQDLPKPKRRWFSFRARPAPPAGEDLLGEIAASISELTAIRNMILQQMVAIDRIAQELEKAADRLGSAGAKLAALSEALHSHAQSAPNPAAADAVGSEIVPVAVQRQQALQLELALATRARLELAAIQQGNTTLANAVEEAIRAARFVGGVAEAIGNANQELVAVRREQQALRDALPTDAVASPRHPDLIDSAEGAGTRTQLSSLSGALAGVAAAMAQLGTAQARLETIASGALPRARS